MKELFFRTLTDDDKERLNKACSQTIDFLRQRLALEKWECYFVVKILFEEFPFAEKRNFKDELHELITKHNLKQHIFVGCSGENHAVSFFGAEKSLVKMLDETREAIEQYFSVNQKGATL